MSRARAFVHVALAAVLAACADVVVDAGSNAQRPSGGAAAIGAPSDSIPTDRIPECPATRPDENSPCTAVGSTCEYGSSPDTQCNATLACEGDPVGGVGAWTARPSRACPTHECPPEGAMAALDGKPCDLPSVDGGAPSAVDELECQMVDGLCACTTGPDAAHAHPRIWVCIKPDLDCPVVRPSAGRACTTVRRCDYGSCQLKRGVRMECNGVWLTGGSPTCG